MSTVTITGPPQSSVPGTFSNLGNLESTYWISMFRDVLAEVVTLSFTTKAQRQRQEKLNLIGRNNTVERHKSGMSSVT